MEKIFTHKINHDLMHLLDSFAREAKENPIMVESNHQTNKGRRTENLKYLPSKW